jgi:hypothetical protein
MTHCDKSLPFTKISWDLSFSKHTSTGRQVKITNLRASEDEPYYLKKFH